MLLGLDNRQMQHATTHMHHFFLNENSELFNQWVLRGMGVGSTVVTWSRHGRVVQCSAVQRSEAQRNTMSLLWYVQRSAVCAAQRRQHNTTVTTVVTVDPSPQVT